MPDSGTVEIALPPTVSLEWLHNERMVKFMLKAATREAIDAWANKSIEVIQLWEENKTYLALHDVTGSFLSPYARQRSNEIALVIRNAPLKGRYAVVVAPNVIGRTIMLFINREFRLASANPNVEGRCFTDAVKAQMWLEEFL